MEKSPHPNPLPQAGEGDSRDLRYDAESKLDSRAGMTNAGAIQPNYKRIRLSIPKFAKTFVAHSHANFGFEH
jgi:hypothetical protein